MADKRASISNRVAIPRVASPSLPQAINSDNAIARAIGAKVRITTTANPPRTFEGYLFTAHALSNILTLTPTYPPAPETSPALTVLPLASVQALTILTPSQHLSTAPASSPAAGGTKSTGNTPPTVSLPTLPPLLDSATQNQRLRAAVAKLQAEDARRGKGVTKEAQEIFDAISRTLPAHWDGENIVVLNQVVICKPYRVEDCKAGKDVQGQMVARIKKVLENERKKISEKAGAGNGAKRGS